MATIIHKILITTPIGNLGKHYIWTVKYIMYMMMYDAIQDLEDLFVQVKSFRAKLAL